MFHRKHQEDIIPTKQELFFSHNPHRYNYIKQNSLRCKCIAIKKTSNETYSPNIIIIMYKKNTAGLHLSGNLLVPFRELQSFLLQQTIFLHGFSNRART